MATDLYTYVETAVNKALTGLGFDPVPYKIDIPKDINFGDVSVNVALIQFSKLNKADKEKYRSPRNLAESITSTLIEQTLGEGIFDKIEVAGAGYINFRLSNSYITTAFNEICEKGSSYGKNESLIAQKIVVEYTDPNPFKEFHIGHLFSNTIGESLSRLLQNNGATVWRADYFGDVGMHVSKSIWGLLQSLEKDTLTFTDLSKRELPDKIAYLGQAYAFGASAYEADPNAKQSMKELNFIIYEVAQRFLKEQRGFTPLINYRQYCSTHSYDAEVIFNLYKTCREWSLNYFETIYDRLGTRFDGYYPESIVGEYGYKTVKDHLNDTFEVGEGGAVIFPGSRYGLHDRVFINSLGLPTYECKELGLAPAKYEDFNYTQSLIVTGNEINDYFNVLIKAMTLVLPQFGSVTTHLGHGMVRLPQGKMSSRTGKVITGISMMDEFKNRALAIIETLNPDLAHKHRVADQIGIAAIKYAFLKSNIGADVTFRFEDAVTFNGNSGPYLQYTYARCRSVLAKSGQNNGVTPIINDSIIPNPEESDLEHLLIRFPLIVKTAADQLSPHLLCTYLFQCAQSYNLFYNRHSILGKQTSPVTDAIRHFRLCLTQATAQVLQNGLTLLGIETPEKM